MFFIYNILIILVFIIYLPVFLFKSLKKGQISQLKERLGIIDKSIIKKFKDRKTIWIHAASVGETLVGEQIVERLRRRYPDYAILFSTMTSTANKLAETNIKGIDGLIYLPIDIHFIIKKVIKHFQIELLVLVETELWPNLIKISQENGTRVIVTSGRIGDKSFKNYQRLKPFLKKVLVRISSFCMQSNLDAERIITLGASDKKVKICGNIKYDKHFEKKLKQESILNFNIETPVFVAGSTHDDEERQLLEVYKEVKGIIPDFKMIIAPRYIDRADDIRDLYLNNDISVKKWTDLFKKQDKEFIIDNNIDVVIVDTFGELAGLYQIATLVFVGGSLITRGGHNILEPAAYGKTIFVGPYMFNFKEDLNYFKENGALIQVSDRDELAKEIIYYLENKALIKEKGNLARELIENNKGALEKNIQEIDNLLGDKPRILLVRLSAIGDVIHALPAAKAVRDKYPEAEINWLIEDRIADFISLNPYIDNIIVMPRSQWKKDFKNNKWQVLKKVMEFMQGLKGYNFDIVVDMHGMFKSALPTGMSGANHRFGRIDSREASTLFYNRKITIPDELTHKIDRNIYLVKEALGVSINEIDYGLKTGKPEKEKVDRLLEKYYLLNKKFIVINPFTTWESKNWILKRYIKLAKKLQNELKYDIIFTGGPEDRKKIEIAINDSSVKAYNFAGDTSLRELAELYQRAVLYIGGDTGPMHLAIAVDLPVIAIMGPTDPKEFGPYGSKNIVIRDDSLPCINCWKRKCRNNLQCMNNISVDQVFRSVVKLLKREQK